MLNLSEFGALKAPNQPKPLVYHIFWDINQIEQEREWRKNIKKCTNLEDLLFLRWSLFNTFSNIHSIFWTLDILPEIVGWVHCMIQVILRSWVWQGPRLVDLKRWLSDHYSEKHLEENRFDSHCTKAETLKEMLRQKCQFCNTALARR